jgi:hypothetical protein
MPDDSAIPATAFEVFYGTGGTRAVVRGSFRETSVYDLTNGKKYEVYVRAKNDGLVSDDSNVIEVTPHADLPGAPTLLSATGVWDGLQVMFRGPADKDKVITSWNAYVNGQAHAVTNVTGTDLLTGYVHGLPNQTATVAVTGVATPYGETARSGEVAGVVVGTGSVKPKASGLNVGGAMQIGVGLVAEPEGPWTKINLFAKDPKGILTTTNLDRESGRLNYSTKALTPGTEYSVSYSVSYPAGNSSESNALKITLPLDFDPTPPRDWTLVNDGPVKVVVTVKDEVRVPRTGVVVEVDGFVFPAQSGSTATVTDHLSPGVESKVRIAFDEINGKRSDWSEVKTIVPLGKPVTAPSITGVNQGYQDLVGSSPVLYQTTPDGIVVLFTDGECGYSRGDFVYSISTDGGKTWGAPVQSKGYQDSKTYVEFKVGSPFQGDSATYAVRLAIRYFIGSVATLGPWSEARSVTVYNYRPLSAPRPATLSVLPDKVVVSWGDTAPAGCHVTGIVQQITVNGVVKDTKVLPASWAGDQLALPAANVGDKYGVSYAWQAWADLYVYGFWKAVPVTGAFLQEMTWVKTAANGPEVVDVIPKAEA